MAILKDEKKVATVMTAAVTCIVLFLLLLAFTQYIVLPRLQPVWQGNLVWLGAALLATLAILSGWAQLTGYSFRDLLRPVALEQSRNDERGQAQELIDKIQSELYGDDCRLPYILTLCVELCDQIGLPEDYKRWIMKELNGYSKHEKLREEFSSGDECDEWLKRWASHRLIETYIKMQYRADDTTRIEISDMPFKPMFISFPISEVIKINSAKTSGENELAVPLLELGQEHFEELQEFLERASVKMNVPRDLLVFHKVSEFKRILNGVRRRVLSLLSDARNKRI